MAIKENDIKIGFSHPVRNLSNLELSVTDTENGSSIEFAIESKGKKNRDLASSWVLKLKDHKSPKLILKLKSPENSTNTPLDMISLETADGHKLFRTLEVTIENQVFSASEKENDQSILDTLKQILDE